MEGNWWENHSGECAGPCSFGYYYAYPPDNSEKLVCSEYDNVAWLKKKGTPLEYKVAVSLEWLAFSLCIASLGFYAWNYYRATCGWEEPYVCIIELIAVLFELFHLSDTPASIYLPTGNQVLWVRFAEWYLSCPVILIHLSNITGLKDAYSKRTMALLVSDLGTITMGLTSAFAMDPVVKWPFFFAGLLYGMNTFYIAAKVYIESYHMVPKGTCRNLVRSMAWCYFGAWTLFPIMFVFSPTGINLMSNYAANIGFCVIDIISKNMWSMIGHVLRNKIHEHIIIHGNLVKPTKLSVAGMEIETEEMVEENEEGAIDKGTGHLANRESFIIMRDRMKKQGVDVRASLGDDDTVGTDKEMGTMGAMGGAPLEPGRVILAVPDISMIEFFQQQFASLSAPIELVPALGAENTLALVQQAMGLGGLDCVLLHPEFLMDQSPNGMASRLKAAGQRVVAFGWSPVGPMRQLIEGSGLDGFLEGPSFGSGINLQQLASLVARMQQMRKMQQMQMMGMMGMGGNMGMMGGGNNNNMMAINNNNNNNPNMMGGNNHGMMGGNPNMMGGGNNPNMRMGNMQMGGMGNTQQQNSGTIPLTSATSNRSNVSMGGMGGMGMGGNGMMGANPLYNSGGMGTPGNVTPPTPNGVQGPAASEAEMLQQLMAEISRLKNDLGEN